MSTRPSRRPSAGANDAARAERKPVTVRDYFANNPSAPVTRGELLSVLVAERHGRRWWPRFVAALREAFDR